VTFQVNSRIGMRCEEARSCRRAILVPELDTVPMLLFRVNVLAELTQHTCDITCAASDPLNVVAHLKVVVEHPLCRVLACSSQLPSELMAL
jgi:hypothetical protein